jgi:hypothetical protein
MYEAAGVVLTRLEIDQDVEAVAEFMQRNIPASKLVAVSDSIKALAPIMWGAFRPRGN